MTLQRKQFPNTRFWCKQDAKEVDSVILLSYVLVRQGPWLFDILPTPNWLLFRSYFSFVSRLCLYVPSAVRSKVACKVHSSDVAFQIVSWRLLTGCCVINLLPLFLECCLIWGGAEGRENLTKSLYKSNCYAQPPLQVATSEYRII